VILLSLSFTLYFYLYYFTVKPPFTLKFNPLVPAKI